MSSRFYLDSALKSGSDCRGSSNAKFSAMVGQLILKILSQCLEPYPRPREESQELLEMICDLFDFYLDHKSPVINYSHSNAYVLKAHP